MKPVSTRYFPTRMNVVSWSMYAFSLSGSWYSLLRYITVSRTPILFWLNIPLSINLAIASFVIKFDTASKKFYGEWFLCVVLILRCDIKSVHNLQYLP